MATENLGVLAAIQACGPMTTEEIKEIIEMLYTTQTGVYDVDEDAFRDAVEEALEEE